MATERNTTRAKSPATQKPKTTKPVVTEIVSEMAEPVERKTFSAKDVDLNQQVVVRNGYQGRLIYKSVRTNEKYVWPEFGSEQVMELVELRNAKNTYKKYFQNNWFMFDDDYAWVIDYLGVSPFYRYALKIDNFDDLFQLPADEIEDAVRLLSAGQKSSVAYRARQLIADGEIDSNKAIIALERSLGIELVER